ncbi:hypothetical protein BT63DRAFT_318477 [Microthyrium microscopicum]|uniref:HMG box domain-containing protein n=1 Tax=Microthyrium microscopicum TaxID=703497 RepID=A0A6A6U3E0_9PEZI|nr:hypothetical protein BT63DRAFT_318477 [Microthyrium microscopicum]
MFAALHPFATTKMPPSLSDLATLLPSPSLNTSTGLYSSTPPSSLRKPPSQPTIVASSVPLPALTTTFEFYKPNQSTPRKMAAKPTSSKAAEPRAEPAPAPQTITINVDELLRTREQLVTGLSNISSAINEFSRSYIQHTNKWVGAEMTGLPPALDISAMSNLFGTNSSNPLTSTLHESTDKKRKPTKQRKARDPNAPKRPLTAYFLYAKSARPVVKADFENQHLVPSANQISEEILKRWKEMPDGERHNWKQVYEKNADAYRAELQVYRDTLGQAAAPEEDDEAHEEPEDAIAGAVADDDDDSDSSDDEATTAPPVKSAKAAKAAKPKKTTTTTAKPQTQSSPSPSAQLLQRPTASAVPLPGSEPVVPSSSNTGSGKRKATSNEAKADEQPKKKKSRKAKGADAEEPDAKPAVDAKPVKEGKEKKKRSKKE